MNLLFSGAANDVLQIVNADIIVGAEISMTLDGQEFVAFLFGFVFGLKLFDGDLGFRR